MKYFLHDTNSFDDEKITELYLRFGYEGVGLFYTLLEKIAKQEKPMKTSVLKAQLKVRKKLEKCWNFMDEIGLISSNNGETFNEKLLNYSENYQIKKEKTREKVKQWRERQTYKKDVTSYETVSNHPKVKLSKVNESKSIELRETKFISDVYTYENYPKEMLQAFIFYWIERNTTGKKMKFELQQTFEISRRLAKWASNDNKFNNKVTISEDDFTNK
jgi:hypothetical protein